MKRINAWVITVLSMIFIVIIGVLGYFQLLKYEDGVMEIYATQQDGYVQVVLDQINLLDDRSDEEMVNDILKTLDSSSNKYWTLSNKDALIFVKDVLETNRYKGFTTATYYVSDSAKSFIANLKTNKVTHSIIEMDQETYIASGVEFEYRGEEYRICLLTNSNVVLDHNAYLSAKINLSTLAAIILAAVVVTAALLSNYAEKRYRECIAEKETNVELRNKIEELNKILARDTLYDTRYMAFNEKALRIVLEKLEKKNGWPLDFALIDCESIENRKIILERSQSMLDRRVLRFLINSKYVLFITLQSKKVSDDVALTAVLNCKSQKDKGKDRAKNQVKDQAKDKVKEMNIRIAGRMYLEEAPKCSLADQCEQFYKKVTEYGK